jgi:hypothetical protein
VIVVNREPVLVAEPSEPRVLTVYGQAGASFAIEHSTNLSANAWQLVLRHPQVNLADRIEVGGSDSLIFYRASRFEASPALLVLNVDRGLILFGELGKTYRIESATSLGRASVWRPQEFVTLTNSWQLIKMAESVPSRYFRAVDPGTVEVR